MLSTYSATRGWLTALEHQQSNNSVLARYEYTRDAAGHIISVTQPSDHAVAYGYDAAYQLTSEERTGSNAYAIGYSYDAAGNRLTKVQNSVTENYTYGDNNQLLTAGSKTYAYDANGNLTSVTVGTDVTSLTWDYNNKLTGITYPSSSTNSFTTNDLGHRVGLTDSGGSTSYLYDGSRVLSDSRADYTHGGVTGLISERVGSTSKVYHGDQLGSTRGLSNGSEAITDSREYDAWGLTIASAGSGSPFGFVGGQGYQKDPDSGLMLLGARYYDPSVGRFISRDPSRYAGGFNLYGYCGNKPVDATDPSGLISREGLAGGIAAAIVIALTCEVTVPLLVIGIGIGAIGGSLLGGNDGATVIGDGAEAAVATEVIATTGAIGLGMIGTGGRGGGGGGSSTLIEGIYEFPDAWNPGYTYVGQSGDLPRRLTYWTSVGRIGDPAAVVMTPVQGGKLEREIAEQTRIDALGGLLGGGVSNQRNPIGDARLDLAETLGYSRPPWR